MGYQGMFNFDFTGDEEDANPLKNYVELTEEQKRKKQEEETFQNLPWYMKYDKQIKEGLLGSDETPSALGQAVKGVEFPFEQLNKGIDVVTSAIAGVHTQPFRKTLEGALPVEDIGRMLDPEQEKIPEEVSKPVSEVLYKGLEAASDPSQLIPLGLAGPAGAALTAPIFAPKLISSGASDIGAGTSEALRENDPAEGNRLIASGASDIAMGGLMVKHPLEEAGSIVAEKIPSVNEPLAPLGSPISERGALGPDISKVNSFEQSQYRKYGPEWKRLQPPEEAAYHDNLLKGGLPPIDPTERALSRIQDPEMVTRVNELVTEGYPLDRATRIAKAERSEIPEEHLTMEDIAAVLEKDRQKNLPEEVTTPPIAPIHETNIEAPPMEAEPLIGDPENAMVAEPLGRGRPKNIENLNKPPAVPVPNKPILEGITDKDTFMEAWHKLPPSQQGLEILNTFKSLRASGDIGQVLRQGKMLTLDMLFNDPKALKESLSTMAKQGWSEQEFKDVQKSYESDPTIKHYQEDFGLDLPGVGKNLKEEAFHGNIAEKIPVIGKRWIRPSDRVYTAYLNAARVWKMNNIVDKMKEAGLDPAKPEDAWALKLLLKRLI